MTVDKNNFLFSDIDFTALKIHMNLIGSIVIALDEQGKIVFINQSGCKIIECSPSEAVGKNWIEDFVPDSEKPLLKKMITRFFGDGDGKPITNDNPFITASGNLHYLHWNNSTIRDDSGKIILMLSSGEDITQQINASKLLCESESRLKKAEELVIMGNWERNLYTGKYICSDGFFKIMGYEKDEIKPVLVNFLATVHPDDKEKTKLSVENSYKNNTGYSIEFRIIRKDGELRYIKAESLFSKDSNGVFNKAFGTVRDITETRNNSLL